MSLAVDIKYLRLLSSRLRNFKQKNTHIFNMSCPICGDSKTNLSKARGYAFQKGNKLIYKCHNCGVGTNMANFLRQIDENLYKEYTLETYSSGESNNRTAIKSVINIKPPRFGKLDKKKYFDHAEWCDKLPENHFCYQYLKSRKVPDKIFSTLLFTENYKQFIDSVYPNHDKVVGEEPRLVIPFYDEHDELIAVSGRALTIASQFLRYVTIRTNESEDKLVFGLDRIDKNKKVLIVEGQFDSLFLPNCVASCDANLTRVIDVIKTNSYVLIWDNEPRNKEILRIMQEAIKKDFSLVIWPDNTVGKDINEMVVNGTPIESILNTINSNIYRGVEAQLRFNFWKKL